MYSNHKIERTDLQPIKIRIQMENFIIFLVIFYAFLHYFYL